MNKQSLLLILSLFLASALSAQEEVSIAAISHAPKWSAESKETSPPTRDEMAEAIAKELKLLTAYLAKEIKYPEVSRDYNVEGKIVFLVVFDGTIKDLKVVQSLNPECDKIAEAAIRKYVDSWDKSLYDNIPELTFRIPIDFRMAGL